MRQLLKFLYKYRAFFLFIVLQVVCTVMIVSNNNYQRSVYLNTTASIAGGLIERTDNISDFVALKKVNKELSEENARLRQLLLSLDASSLDSLDPVSS